MIERPPVVVGIDGSRSALHAVRWAVHEARRRDAVLEQGRLWLNQAADAARAADPDVPLNTDLRDGVVADILVRESQSAELIVLGSRGLGGFTGLLIGSVAVALSAHSHCPVAVIQDSTVDTAPPETGPVVVGVDGSTLSDAAVAFAFEAAAARGVPLIAVHTWFDADMTGAWTALPWTIDWTAIQADEEKLLDKRLASWRDKHPEVEVRTVVERDRPVRALLHQATGAQLIVVGSRGRGALTGLGLGSVSQSLLHHAECPIAIVRTGHQG